MKHISFEFSDTKALDKAVKKVAKHPSKSVLIQIFTALDDTNKIQKILQKLENLFPHATIVGATTAGEISRAKMLENSTVVSLSLFSKTRLKVHYVDTTTATSGATLAQAVCVENTKAAIILSEGLNGADYQNFLIGFRAHNPNVIVAGGLAGDNFQLKQTFIFLGTKIYFSGSVAVSFSGEELYASNYYNLNWVPIGKEFTITSSKGTQVMEIDGVGAVTFFKTYLGDTIFDDGSNALPHFQLLYQNGTTTVARTPMARDGESLIFAAPIQEGQKVQFGFSNAQAVISGSKNIAHFIAQAPAQAIYIYSCIARKTLLGKVLENEFASFETIAPTAGFFTYGEYYSTDNNNALLNCTSTLLILSESQKNAGQNLKKNRYQYDSLGSATFDALTHFVNQTSRELNVNLKLLNQYKDVVDASLLVSKTDLEGTIIYVNDNFCQISQYTREELLGHNHSIVRDAGVSSMVFEKMWATIQNGRIWRGRFPNRAKDGSVYYVSATVMPVYDDHGEICEYIAIRQNITKQVTIKKKMKEKERLIQAIFDNQENIVVYGVVGLGMLYVNKILFTHFDFKNLEEFKSHHTCICELFMEIEGYIYPALDPDWLTTIFENTTQDYKVKMRFKDDTVHTFKIKVNIIENEYVINLFDITSLEQALFLAHSSQQAKSIFLANMSHEIRTPLNGILGFTDILTKKELPLDVKKYINIIHNSGQTLLATVNDILDFSKLESGELSIECLESNLFNELESCVATFASISKAKNIDYCAFIDTQMPRIVSCDPHRIKQVLNNLISNAIKFTPEGGAVSVAVSANTRDNLTAVLSFSVSDSGIGISKENIDTIFQPFLQADNTISRQFGGTGLGLTISSQYVEAMGGKLLVKSELGMGSQFYFDLILPIIDSGVSLQPASLVQTKIALLGAKDVGKCHLDDAVSTYLLAWGCDIVHIAHLDALSAATDIVIVSSKIFEQEQCRRALEDYSNVHFIYLEGGEENFHCKHPRFHEIAQPITGSALFDTIITVSQKGLTPTLPSSVDNKITNFKGSVLVAEDNETNQILISVLLEEREVDFTIVGDGLQAVNATKLQPYDLILMDINMPVMDGIEAMRILREQGYEHPIVSLSANVMASDVDIFLAAGANATLTKPLVVTELDSILQRFLVSKSVDRYTTDIVDIDVLHGHLKLSNRSIIVKLLESFNVSAKASKEAILTTGLDKEMLHALKGTSGNLRFNELYGFVCDLERTFELLTLDQVAKENEKVLHYLQAIIDQIDLLEK